MTMRSSDRAYEKALAALTREAADLATPELDWDKLETRVLAAFTAASETPAPTARSVSAVRKVAPPTWVSSPWPMGLAAAAAAMLIYGGSARTVKAPARSSTETAAASTPKVTATELATLEVGEVVETTGRAAHYDKPGVVSLALAPNSRFEVVANDLEREGSGGVTVNLERGTIHAEVTPRPLGEVFAVEVERTRIAVHGTSFTVTREGNTVIVDVAHGSVAVGPVGHRGATHGWLVVGPNRAAFSLDGAREATWFAPPEEPAVAVVERAAEPHLATVDPHSARAKRPATAPSHIDAASPPSRGQNNGQAASRSSAWGEGGSIDGRDPGEQEATESASIVRQVAACYEKQASALGFRFSVESSLKLTILPTGAIREGVFTPPLSPTLMSCADKAIGGAHFPSGEAVRDIVIPVHLGSTSR